MIVTEESNKDIDILLAIFRQHLKTFVFRFSYLELSHLSHLTCFVLHTGPSDNFCYLCYTNKNFDDDDDDDKTSAGCVLPGGCSVHATQTGGKERKEKLMITVN